MLHTAPAPVISRSANETFRRLYSQRHRHRLWHKITGRPNRLLELRQAEAALTVKARRDAGIRRVPLAQIRGSEARGQDFDLVFRPLKHHCQERWVRIAIIHARGQSLPAVELVQIGDTYFVRDGHHRISVANALGQIDIDAHVVIWEVQGNVEETMIPSRQHSLAQRGLTKAQPLWHWMLHHSGCALINLGSWMQRVHRYDIAPAI